MFQYIKSVKKLFQNLHISNLCSIFAIEFKIYEDYEINKVEKSVSNWQCTKDYVVVLNNRWQYIKFGTEFVEEK